MLRLTFVRITMTGVFRDPEAALRASERLRELDTVGSVRLFLPGAEGKPVEMSVVEERSPWLRLTSFGLVAGFLCAYVALSLSPSWLLAAAAR